ncbi:MAG TPA: hypothetical protein VK699_13510 [Terriglobales bacterium]|jgi:hypothetical protein|nr:hypothetical protein [Terriglobales bacterium]
MRIRHIKPVITLMLITPFLTEVLTTNVNITTMLRPRILLAMMTIGYGFAVLVLRELAFRMKAGVVGLVLLGLIYGIYNEGIIAKTFLRVHDVPINIFDGYGLYGGMETGWAMAISTWHAFFAFMFPIIIVHSLYPGEREEPWLNRKVLAVLAAITLLISALAFFGKGDRGTGIAGTPGQYLVLALISSLLYLLALRYAALGKISAENIQAGGAHWPAIEGFCMYLAVILVPTVLAAARIPIVLYVVYFGVLAWLSLRRVRAQSDIALGSLLMFAFGGQFAVALFALIVAFKRHSMEPIISSSIFLAGLGYLLFRQSRSRVYNESSVCSRPNTERWPSG